MCIWDAGLVLKYFNIILFNERLLYLKHAILVFRF